MHIQDRSLGLLTQIARGLLLHDRQRTAQTLGDRSAYIGMSDLGRALTCQRAAVASKLGLAAKPSGDDLGHWFHHGNADQITAILRQQLVLQRGHWLEAGIEAALRANGLNLICQLELSIIDNGVPICAHLDFVLIGGSTVPVIRVLELKSTEHLPQVLYPAYEAQIYGQIGLLSQFWDQPVFNLKDDTGKTILERQTFPQICRYQFGLTLPDTAVDVDLEGWVLCLSMSEARPFGPYRPHIPMLELCRRTAQRLWQDVHEIKDGQRTLNDLTYCAGFHPLCDWCDHAEGCPKFRADPVDDPVLDDDLKEFAKLKADKAEIETELAVYDARIRQFYGRSSSGKGWLSTPYFRFKSTRIAGRKTLDLPKLRAELTNRLGEAEADAVIVSASNEGEPYDRLTVSPITTAGC